MYRCSSVIYPFPSPFLSLPLAEEMGSVIILRPLNRRNSGCFISHSSFLESRLRLNGLRIYDDCHCRSSCALARSLSLSLSLKSRPYDRSRALSDRNASVIAAPILAILRSANSRNSRESMFRISNFPVPARTFIIAEENRGA